MRLQIMLSNGWLLTKTKQLFITYDLAERQPFSYGVMFLINSDGVLTSDICILDGCLLWDV